MSYANEVDGLCPMKGRLENVRKRVRNRNCKNELVLPKRENGLISEADLGARVLVQEGALEDYVSSGTDNCLVTIPL